MIHDLELVEKLGDLKQESFDGHVFRVTSLNADPTASSTVGGRWAPSAQMDGGFSVLYTCLDRNGAIAEVATYIAEMTPVPGKSLMVHELIVTTSKTITLALVDLTDLGVDISRYGERDYERTQLIGAAINFLGRGGLVASARWKGENLIIFSENHSLNDRLESLNSEQVEVREWHGMVGIHADFQSRHARQRGSSQARVCVGCLGTHPHGLAPLIEPLFKKLSDGNRSPLPLLREKWPHPRFDIPCGGYGYESSVLSAECRLLTFVRNQ